MDEDTEIIIIISANGTKLTVLVYILESKIRVQKDGPWKKKGKTNKVNLKQPNLTLYILVQKNFFLKYR